MIFLVATMNGQKAERITDILGPYNGNELVAIQRGRRTLNSRGADNVYRVRARSTEEARTNVLKDLKEWDRS